MNKTIIELKNVSKSFAGKKIIDQLSLEINERDSLMIIGPGGRGKTVLMKIMALIIPPDSGDIFYYGRNIKDFSKKDMENYQNNTGMLFQNYALFDSMTVRENVGFFLDYHTKIPRKEIGERVSHNLKQVKLEGVEGLKPAQLSGGMKKRVGIARAINYKPDIIFLDEPTAGLDPITTDSISKMINRLHQELPVTFISVTNDMGCARKIGNKLAMLYEGKIYKIGPKEDIFESDDPVIHQFVNGKRQGPIRYHEKVD
ncbi:MAG: ABC transporter ATP-binding protein [bacterium]|nr:MAG: ABC transporter ATP-binding protein [bacterium]